MKRQFFGFSRDHYRHMRFVLHLPDFPTFAKADLNKDRKHELEKREK